jgi:inorganic pyrophosphatase
LTGGADGALPQTWEDPEHISPDTGFCGDNDPIDAIEIGTRQLRTGDVVKVLRAWRRSACATVEHR